VHQAARPNAHSRFIHELSVRCFGRSCRTLVQQKLKELSVFADQFLELATGLRTICKFRVCSAVDKREETATTESHREKGRRPSKPKVCPGFVTRTAKITQLRNYALCLAPGVIQLWHVHSAIPIIKGGFLPNLTSTHLTGSRTSTSRACGHFLHYSFVKTAALPSSFSAVTSFAV